MQEIGNFHGPEPLRTDEEMAHWGLWSITSAPLILGSDLSNSSMMDRIWPTITNKEALAINDAWVGHPGTLIRSYFSTSSNVTYTADHAPCDKLPKGATAIGWELTAAGQLQITLSSDNGGSGSSGGAQCLTADLAPTGQKLLYDGCPPPTTHYAIHGCGVVFTPCGGGAKGRWTHLPSGALSFNSTSTGNAQAQALGDDQDQGADALRLKYGLTTTAADANADAGAGGDGAKCLSAKPSSPVGGFYGGAVSQSTATSGCPNPKSKNPPANTSSFAFKDSTLVAGSGVCIVARPLYAAQLWAKPLPGGKVAVLVLNLLTSAEHIDLPLADIPGAGASSCKVRDVWKKKDLPAAKGVLSLRLRGHQSLFMVLDCATETKGLKTDDNVSR